MSARTRTNDVVSRAPPYRRASTYRVCDDCGHGAVVWDERARESRCSDCGAPYRGPATADRGGLPC